MSALTTHAQGVAAAERELLVSTCRATRPSTEDGVYDEETNTTIPAPPIVLWETRPCRLRLDSSTVRVTVAVDAVAVQKPILEVSITAPALAIGDTVTLVTSPVGFNIGRSFTVAGMPAGDLVVLARYELQGVTQ
jgi:hypothetical protein